MTNAWIALDKSEWPQVVAIAIGEPGSAYAPSDLYRDVLLTGQAFACTGSPVV